MPSSNLDQQISASAAKTPRMHLDTNTGFNAASTPKNSASPESASTQPQRLRLGLASPLDKKLSTVETSLRARSHRGSSRHSYSEMSPVAKSLFAQRGPGRQSSPESLRAPPARKTNTTRQRPRSSLAHRTRQSDAKPFRGLNRRTVSELSPKLFAARRNSRSRRKSITSVASGSGKKEITLSSSRAVNTRMRNPLRRDYTVPWVNYSNRAMRRK